MKAFSLLAALFIASIPAAQAGAALTMFCKNMEMVDFDDEHNPIYIPSNVSVNIAMSPEGKYSYIAYVTDAEGNSYIEKDVQYSEFPSTQEQAGQAQEMLEFLAPQVKWSDVKTLRHGNVGVEANLVDAGGMNIIEYLAKDGRSLAKLVTIGWGFGRCQQ